MWRPMRPPRVGAPCSLTCPPISDPSHAKQTQTFRLRFAAKKDTRGERDTHRGKHTNRNEHRERLVPHLFPWYEPITRNCASQPELLCERVVIDHQLFKLCRKGTCARTRPNESFPNRRRKSLSLCIRSDRRGS
jgi:hypothetical protein